MEVDLTSIILLNAILTVLMDAITSIMNYILSLVREIHQLCISRK